MVRFRQFGANKAANEVAYLVNGNYIYGTPLLTPNKGDWAIRNYCT